MQDINLLSSQVERCNQILKKLSLNPNQEDEFISNDANKVQAVTEQNNLDGDAFFYEYKTNCRLEFTKSCLKDAGNSILYGRDLENKHIVKISPNQYIY